MKKILIISILLASLISCKMQFYNDEGFTIFGLGAALEDGQVLVQSHDGFVIEDKIYNEAIFVKPIIVKNVINHKIKVKITDGNNREWINILPLDEYRIDETI